jgi:hypothetical protein
MIYDGPIWIYEAIGPYADLFITSTTASKLLQIYDVGGTPVVDTDYSTATPDSAMWATGKINTSTLTYNSTTDRTQVVVPGFGYRWRKRRFVTWPEAEGTFASGSKPFGGCRGNATECPCGYLNSAAPLAFVEWDTLEWRGNYVDAPHFGKCLHAGGVVQISSSSGGPELYNISTQASRASEMIAAYKEKRGLRGRDGKQFVIGFEHWGLHDPQPSNWLDDENFGLKTSRDNAYDGVEATQHRGVDLHGRPVGGELGDYGDFITPFAAFLNTLF